MGGGGAAGGAAGVVSAGGGYTVSRQVTYIPKPGEDPQTVARALVWRVGGASKRKSATRERVNRNFPTKHTFKNQTMGKQKRCNDKPLSTNNPSI